MSSAYEYLKFRKKLLEEAEEEKKKKSLGLQILSGEIAPVKETKEDEAWNPLVSSNSNFVGVDTIAPLPKTAKFLKLYELYGMGENPVDVGTLNEIERSTDKAREDYKTQLNEYYKELAEEKKKAEEEAANRTWFQKGALEDGVNLKNVLKAYFGTGQDLSENLMAGAISPIEALMDTGAMAVGGIGSLFSRDFGDDVRDWIAKDVINEKDVAKYLLMGQNPLGAITNKMLGTDVAKDSLLGDKSDELAQSGGQLAVTVALQMVGVPWYVTSGVTSFGGEVEGAFKNDASYGEAAFSGLVTAGAEILTEKLFGGSGLGEKGLINLEPLTKSITNRALKVLADWGLDMATEGSEEVMSQFMSTLGQQLSYEREEDWITLLSDRDAMDDYISQVADSLFGEEARSAYKDAFIGGAALSSVMNTGKAFRSNKTGRDYRTGLTENEQKVFEKEYNNRLEEAKKNGKNLTNNEKLKLYDQVMEDLKEGGISIDTIESAIGGDTYKSYMDTMKGKLALEDDKRTLQEEAAKIEEIEVEKRSEEQKSRLTELRSKILDINRRSSLPQYNQSQYDLKNQLSEDVQKMLVRQNGKNVQSDDFLLASYGEKTKRGQKYEADLTKYSDKQQEIVKKAIESGFLNNTRRTHALVDMIAKIHEDKGVDFDFVNNKRLQESSYAVNGKTVNGYFDKKANTIGINIDSAKYLNAVVGHEVTHVFEGTEIYDELKTAIFEYAKSKGEYDSRRTALAELYKAEDIDSELVADLVGDYLFSDPDFVKNLSTNHRNVFQKIYDEIKYLLKVATAGSKEARQLEKVKHEFEKLYRESGKASAEANSENVANAGVQHSVSVTDKKTIDFLEKQDHITTYKAMQLIDGKLYPPMAAKVKGEDGKYRLNNPSELGKWQQATEDPTNIKKFKNGVGYYTLNKGNGKSVDAAYNPYEHSSNLVLNDQFEEAYNRDNIVTVECQIPVSEMSSGYKAEYAKDGTGVMDWKSGVVAGKIKDNKRKVYLSRWLKPVRILSDAETAAMYKEVVGDIAVPFNVVTPGLLTELEKAGVNIDYDGSPQYQSIQRRKDTKTADNVATLDGGSVVKHSISTWTPDTQEKVRENLNKVGYESDKVDKWIKDVNGIASVIAANKDRLGFEAADNQVMLKDNQDYIKTLDASTLCAKRLVYQGTFDAIQHRMPNTVLTSDDLIDLLNMMKEHGVQTPCGVCYVESRRRHLGKFAQEWLNSYNGEYKPHLDDLTTSDGLEALRKSHPQVYKDFVDAMNKKGSSNPKVVQLRTEYRNEIMSLTPAQIRKIEAIGGIRVQSFSDFETPHMLDMMQAVMDMAAKGLHSQAYTKVPNFAWVFGDTGIKINLSLIAEGDGFDADGNLAFSSTEGMDFDEAMRLRDAYSDNVGTIIVGANDKHILACMADDRIDFIIPFHRSGWGMKELDMMGMSTYTDYTYGQKEHDLNKPTKVVNGVQQYAGLNNLYPPDYWDYALTGKENAERYLNLCAKTGREPKFSQFLVNNGDGSYSLQPDGSTDGYWKTLIDFKMYNNEGMGVAQQKVQPNFNMDEAYRVLNEYEGGANKLPVANDIVEEFVAKYQAKDIAPVYSLSDSEGNKLSNEQNEYFVDSKIRDENGNLRAMWHGTSADFTVFDINKAGQNWGGDSRLGKGFYFANTRDDALRWTDGSKAVKAYLNITNPLDVDAPAPSNIVSEIDKHIDNKIASFDESKSFVSKEQYIKNLQRIKDMYMKDVSLFIDQFKYDENGKMTDGIREFLSDLGYDGIVSKNETVAFYPEQIKLTTNTNPTSDPDIRYSLSEEDGETPVRYGNIAISGNDVRLEGTVAEEFSAPVREDISTTENTTPTISKTEQVEDIAPTYDYDAERFASLDDKDAPSVADQPIQTVEERLAAKLENTRTELANNRRMRNESNADYDQEIARLQAEYDAKKKKDTRVANDILRRIERLRRMKGNIDADYAKRISDLEQKIAKMNSPEYKTAQQRMEKQDKYSSQMKELIGDTSTWVDKKMGLSYKINTLRRNLRDVVRDENGKRDIAKADAIYDELQGKYNQHEASLNRESNKLKKPYADMKITKAEDAYIQMLGELRHNPDTTLTEDAVKEFYEKNKDKIDKAKVDKAIEMARKTYDGLLERVNEVLREQGMKEIPYRQGYFPHFTDEKQGFLAKLFNWKTQNNDIPTDIAGLTENFNPNRSWQSFNKRRKGDTTDYSFTRGLDTYVHGALDWIYHIEDIQKRRALENYIRYTHSEKGVQDKIDAIRNNESYDADEMQEQIDLVYKEAGNPLNNFVTDLRAGTNRLANKKSSLDRSMEEMTNRKIYSTMTNLSNRVNANMVGGSISAALTNFIPITQSWGEVSPKSSLKAMLDTIKSTIRNDGVVDKSDFLTNRLKKEDSLYKTTWDKIGDKVGLLMDGIDSFTSQTVWRSKYLENIGKGMSESEAIKNADQFAENVIGGRSRGNAPTVFDSKNPLVKALTAFQLEVNNQYGYMFKDMPQDVGSESKAKLVKGYATMFLGAYAYNALYSSLTGRNAAFDPIDIVKDLLEDLGLFGDDEEEEPTDAFMNLAENIFEEVPFIGGLLGGGRIPISSALPYGDGVIETLSGTLQDFSDKDWNNLTKEWLKPLYYLAMPMGGGQLKKTIEGLSMFDDDLPIAGSYTADGKLRFPVDDTLGSRVQAGLFGQWSSKNAQDYLDKGRQPLSAKQTQEFIDLEMPIQEYWEYREGLKGLNTIAEKADYINSLDLQTWQKNIMINNLTDRKEDIDMTDYDNYASFEEFDYASKNPEKHLVSKAVTDDFEAYQTYTKALSDITSDKDANGKTITNSRKTKVVNYLNSLDIEYGAKLILFKSEYNSDHTYNYEIIEYLNSRDDISYSEMETILKELGFIVDAKGNIYW